MFQSRVFVAWILTFACFLISLLVLCAGTKPGFLEDCSLVFISDLSVDYSPQISSNFFPVDTGSESPFSNNSDWGEIYYLAFCQGNYGDDGVSKVNKSCSKSPNPEKVFGGSLQRAMIPWTIGIALSGLDLFLLLLFCGGGRHWNGWMMMFMILTFFALLLGGVFGTVFSYGEFNNDKGGKVFVPLTWTAVGLILLAGFIHSFEYSLQRWTPTGDVIAAKHKPAKVPWMQMDRYYWTNPR